MADALRPELVVGLIGPVGCGLQEVTEETQKQLQRFGYEVRVVKVSEEFRSLEPWASLPTSGPKDEHYELYMDAGDDLRRRMRRKDAAMYPTLTRLRLLRAELTRASEESPKPADGYAFIIDSLKTPEELQLLRSIYGDRFISIAAYASRAFRRNTVAKDIAESRNQPRPERHLTKATGIVERDERGVEENTFGQNVSAAFPLADYFVHSGTLLGVQQGLTRFFNLLFGHPYVTPTKQELCMFMAHACALRSASMSRQVGAVIATASGQILGSGANEVPKAGGGQYWEDDEPDGRDFRGGQDTSTIRRRALVYDVMKFLLETAQWDAPGHVLPAIEQSARSEQVQSVLQSELERLKGDQSYRGLLVNDVLEFYREAHAEMAALLDVARTSASTQGCELYVTTFPCHECARHIVAAGISRVVFIEPYPKSLVAELMSDSIVLDPIEDKTNRIPFETFVGVGPRRYMRLFRMRERKTTEGLAVQWNEDSAEPQVQAPLAVQEHERLKVSFQDVDSVGIFRREAHVVLDLDETYKTLVTGGEGSATSAQIG